MKFHEIIQNRIFDLPKSQDDDSTFDVFIEKLLRDYIDLLRKVDDDLVEIENTGHIIDTYVDLLEHIVNGILKAIKEYYNGMPSKAYKTIDDLLSGKIQGYNENFVRNKYDVGENFYRIRLNNSNYTFSKKELFHIPFEDRGKVLTQRFSIPGFPSLYLGKTLYICWEEMSRPQINEFQTVRLTNKKEISFLDLTPPDLSTNIYRSETFKYFMTWPFIACCSVKVKNSEDTFKPEYIIPQLLLQWIRNNDKLDGIRFQSTSINTDLFKSSGDLSNIVIPVKENKITGYCPSLLNMFESTEVISWQLHEYALGGSDLMFSSDDLKYIDEKIPKVEFIKGRQYPYSYSVLGTLEHYLDNMDTKSII